MSQLVLHAVSESVRLSAEIKGPQTHGTNWLIDSDINTLVSRKQQAPQQSVEVMNDTVFQDGVYSVQKSSSGVFSGPTEREHWSFSLDS